MPQRPHDPSGVSDFLKSKSDNNCLERHVRKFLIALGVLAAACSPLPPAATEGRSSPNDWLLAAESDEARFKLIQRQMRGFDQPMWEVGERFERLHDALKRENFELATYQWDKIKTSIENGTVKRPARAVNTNALFLGEPWGEVRAGLASGDRDKAWAAFETARIACQSCHQAEKVEYMNDQAVFDLMPPNGKR